MCRQANHPTSIETVLVVEYGYFDNSAAQLEPSSATQYQSRDLFNLTAVVQPGLNIAQNSVVYAASVVGGGSTINGMMLDRAAPSGLRQLVEAEQLRLVVQRPTPVLQKGVFVFARQ